MTVTMTQMGFLMWLKGLMDATKVEHGISAVLAAEIKRNLTGALESPPPVKTTKEPLDTIEKERRAEEPPSMQEMWDKFQDSKKIPLSPPTISPPTISLQLELFPAPRSACAVCGLKFDGPMGYVCSNPNCPTAVRCAA